MSKNGVIILSNEDGPDRCYYAEVSSSELEDLHPESYTKHYRKFEAALKKFLQEAKVLEGLTKQGCLGNDLKSLHFFDYRIRTVYVKG